MAIRPPLTATVRGGQGKPDRDEEMTVRWSNKEMETDRRSTLTIIAPYKVYGWFTEGFDTLDLKGAQALLQSLAA